MYGLASIIVICLTILWLFRKPITEIKIIHEYHNHEYLDDKRFSNTEKYEEPKDEYERANKDYPLDEALKKVQETINKVNGTYNPLGGNDE